jgi:hypothetical protein
MSGRTEIDGKIITFEIRNLWKWVYIPRMDPFYFLPTRDFVITQIINASMKEFRWREHTCDCDNLAVILWGKIEERECKEKWKFPMPFGIAYGNLGDGRSHVCNCFYSTSGFEFYDIIGLNVKDFKPKMILM